MSGRACWMCVTGALMVAACGGGGEGSVLVMREGKASESFGGAHFECTVTQAEPPAEIALLDCVHGDPTDGNTGVHLGGTLTQPIADLPAGTTLEHGVDFQVSAIDGGTAGSIWGASGSSSWWTGDLMITLEETNDGGRAAILEGTMQTTDAVDVVPITVDFNVVPATFR